MKNSDYIEVIDIELKEGGDCHGDLILYIKTNDWKKNWKIIVDSYYLALDGFYDPDNKTSDKIEVVLKQLLNNWILLVKEVKAGHNCYLPFDFSDQYTGWIKVFKESNEDLKLSYGYATLEGHRIHPSKLDHYRYIGDYEFIDLIEYETLEIKQGEFIKSIEKIIVKLNIK